MSFCRKSFPRSRWARSVRQGDDAWFNVVKWTYYALLNAEELGITQANVEEMKSSANPEIKRVLGVPNADGTAAGFGTGIGVSEDWVAQIVKGVGNYGEIFERNVGANTPLKIARGVNALVEQRRPAIRTADPLI